MHMISCKINKIKKDYTKKERIRMIANLAVCALMIMITAMVIIEPAFADVAGADTVRATLKDFIKILGLVFQALGVILGVYAVGQLILAIKNDDADSKSRAGTLLVVGIVLIAFPAIVNNLNLVNKVTG